MIWCHMVSLSYFLSFSVTHPIIKRILPLSLSLALTNTHTLFLLLSHFVGRNFFTILLYSLPCVLLLLSPSSPSLFLLLLFFLSSYISGHHFKTFATIAFNVISLLFSPRRLQLFFASQMHFSRC